MGDTEGVVEELIFKWNERQDQGIKREFQRQRQQTDTQFQQLRDHVDARFEQVDARFEQVDARFEQVDARFDKVDARFEQVDARFDKLEALFDDLQTRMMNGGATHIWENILPVFVREKESGMKRPPACFPRRVGDFWRLKQRKYWNDLIRLHEFYGTSSWPEWGVSSFTTDDEEEEEGEDDDDAGEERGGSRRGLAPLNKSLEDAVEYAPDLALEALALRLGLNYEKISQHVEEEMRVRHIRKTLTKRPRIPETLGTDTKRPKTLEPIQDRPRIPKTLGTNTKGPKALEPIQDRGPEQNRSDASSSEILGTRGLSRKFLIGGSTPSDRPLRRDETPSAVIEWRRPPTQSQDDHLTGSPTSVATSLKDR